MILFSLTKMVLLGLLISVGFIFLDWVSLTELPRLGISYGEIKATLTAFILLRGLLFFLWSILLIGIVVGRPGAFDRFILWLLFFLNLLFLGLGIYAFYVEPMMLTVSHLEVPVPGLNQPVRLVQLSDIHVERTTRREQAIPTLVESLRPDMIVMTGDYLNKSYINDPVTRHDLQELISKLHAPLGIYAVNGNGETPEMMRELLAGSGVHFMDNETVRVPKFGDHFVIVGLDYINYRVDESTLAEVMKQVQPGDFSLLLYHDPGLAYAARDQGVNLFLAGHTHGGQVRLPFYGPLTFDNKYGEAFEMGLYHLGETTLFVNRGLGMTGGSAPRVRFLAPPEVVVIDLVPIN